MWLRRPRVDATKNCNIIFYLLFFLKQFLSQTSEQSRASKPVFSAKGQSCRNLGKMTAYEFKAGRNLIRKLQGHVFLRNRMMTPSFLLYLTPLLVSLWSYSLSFSLPGCTPLPFVLSSPSHEHFAVSSWWLLLSKCIPRCSWILKSEPFFFYNSTRKESITNHFTSRGPHTMPLLMIFQSQFLPMSFIPHLYTAETLSTPLRPHSSLSSNNLLLYLITCTMPSMPD